MAFFFPFFLQEALLSVVGSSLLIYSGVVALQAYDHPELGAYEEKQSSPYFHQNGVNEML